MDNILDINEEIKKKKELDRLKEELRVLLESRPDLAGYQTSIEDALNKAGDNPANRLVVLKALFQDQQIKLHKALTEIKESLLKLKESLEKEK